MNIFKYFMKNKTKLGDSNLVTGQRRGVVSWDLKHFILVLDCYYCYSAIIKLI